MRAADELRTRWQQRDVRYHERYATRPSPFVDAALIDGVRTWRMAEAQEIGDPTLVNEARWWTPPAYLR